MKYSGNEQSTKEQQIVREDENINIPLKNVRQLALLPHKRTASRLRRIFYPPRWPRMANLALLPRDYWRRGSGENDFLANIFAPLGNSPCAISERSAPCSPGIYLFFENRAEVQQLPYGTLPSSTAKTNQNIFLRTETLLASVLGLQIIAIDLTKSISSCATYGEIISR